MPNDRPAPERSRRVIRIVAGALIVVAALGVGVMAASAALLNGTWLHDEIAATPQAMVMDWTGARSTFPGRATFETLTLRVRDSNMELQARLHDVELRFSVRELLRRRFHATNVRAQRLTFRLRERLTKAEATEARLATYPAIDGWPRPPLIGVPPEPPPDTDPWRVVIDDLAAAKVTEIWINSYRWRGTGHVAGGFELLPGKKARIGPARIVISGGDLTKGEVALASGVDGDVWCRIPEHDIPKYRGNDIWKIMTGGSTLKGKLDGIEFLTDADGPRFSGGRGAVAVKVDLKDGAGTLALDVDADRADVRTGGKHLRGDVALDLRVPRIDFRKAHASLGGTRVVLSDVSAEDSGTVRAWAATFRTPQAGLDLDDGKLAADVVGKIRDARPIVALMPAGLGKTVANILDLEDLDVSGHVTAARRRLAVDRLSVTSGNFSLTGNYTKVGRATGGRLRAKKGILPAINFSP